MKKLVLILLAACGIMSTAFAQSKSVLVYGNFSVNTSTQDYDGFNVQNSQWFVNPGVGYQLCKRWTIGLQGSYGQSMNPSSNSIYQTITQNNWNAGIFVRYTRFFGNIFSVYGQLDLSNAGGTYDIKENSTSITPQASYIGFRGNFYPALAINIHNGLALNFNVGGISYSSLNWTNHPSALTSETSLNIDFGHSLTIGISKNFSCNRMHGHHEMGEDSRHINTKDDDDDAPKAHKEHKHHKKDKKHKADKKKGSNDDDDE